MTELKCPNCGCELERDYNLNVMEESSYIEVLVTGHCPECEVKYRWTEFFEFDRIDELEEI